MYVLKAGVPIQLPIPKQALIICIPRREVWILPTVLGFRFFAKQCPRSILLIVYRPGVRSEQNADGLVKRTRATIKRYFRLFNKKQPMKMIGHQAIAQQMTVRQKVCAHFPKKKDIIVRLKKDALAIIALIVNVVNGTRLEVHDERF
ncbi:MAG: hypothetical protein SFV52_09165 [Saprospiraceae bacterium]|nr:hypothetical protein [Saprospiraceae bacterium]